MKEILEGLLEGKDLEQSQAADLLHRLVRDPVGEAMTAALLAALRAKGETAEELCGFAGAMGELARRPTLARNGKAVDIVGTGGDGSGSMNLSTGAALLAAACGLPVIKHGNRSVTSRCGSADVMEALGLRLPLEEERAGLLLQRTRFTFLFAPYYHPALAAVGPVRRTLGVRTVFNLLGPITNPAAPPFRIIGASSPAAAELLAETLSRLPLERAFVVHGAGGWDEPTPLGPFTLFDVRPGRVARSVRSPEDFGVPRCGAGDLAGGDAPENARLLRSVFQGERGPRRDAVAMGAALALEVAGLAAEPREGMAMAAEALVRGDAFRLAERLREDEDV
jgi:anthranilate phosphoribosyltransferase